ncbi:MAG: LysR substrate-binding domain-containing protein [Acidobacteriota bacterium]
MRQLRYFLAVAEELHFARAAERVGIAQPPLTQQIQKLERLLGCPLLIRGRKTQLTAAGAKFAEEARRILDQTDRAVEATRRIARGQSGELRVGVPPSVLLTNLPTIILRYKERYPEVDFDLREYSTSAIEQALRAGEIDLGFLRECKVQEPLQSSIFLAENMVVALPSLHPFAALSSVPLELLRDEPFVFFPRRVGPDFYDALLAACAAAGFSPRVTQEATQWQSVISFVEAGMGISIAPNCVRKFRWPLVHYRPIPKFQTKVYVSWRGPSPSPAAAKFLKLLKT